MIEILGFVSDVSEGAGRADGRKIPLLCFNQ